MIATAQDYSLLAIYFGIVAVAFSATGRMALLIFALMALIAIAAADLPL